jgi:hypothetical protein
VYVWGLGEDSADFATAIWQAYAEVRQPQAK